MTLRFTAKSYAHWLVQLASLFVFCGLMLFLGRSASTMWPIALCFTAVWIGLFGWIYSFIAFGEYVHIDENRIELHFLMLQKTIQMADVDRVFDVKNAEGPRFYIKTLTGEKTAIPNRFELVDFIAAARRSYNFKLQEASEENIHKL